MSHLVFTPRERLQMRGFCTGPEDGAPGGLGTVGLDHRAACCTCGKLVAVTVRGRYSHHKPWTRQRAWADRYMVTSVQGRVEGGSWRICWALITPICSFSMVQN